MNTPSHSFPLLLPAPRHLEILEGRFPIPDSGIIQINNPEPQEVLISARILQDSLGSGWQISTSNSATTAGATISLNVVPGGMRHEQEYQLMITAERLDIIAGRPEGVFYGANTLRQLIDSSAGSLPSLRCRDWPDFPHRGVMLDISRDKVPSMTTLYELVDLLASWKINQLQLYTEHTFAYRNHRAVWAEASPMTAEEILALDAYCRERYIELVPNQNSFGHMQRWLQHADYNHLAECPDGFVSLWGEQMGAFTLDPNDPGSLKLVRELYDELLPLFSSKQFNVGCDETFDLGRGKNKALVEDVGEGRVYLDFLMKIYRGLKSRGITMQFWGDILMSNPGLVAELPKDLIALEWGYEAGHPFDTRCAKFAAAGVPFYVCPGTSSWNSIAGRTANAMENLRRAVESGLKHGAVGYLNTDWGDNGHWQPLPVSYLGLAYGAAVSWAYEANRDIDIAAAVSGFAFQDGSGVMGNIAYELGDIYQMSELQPSNASILFRSLQSTPEDLAIHADEAEQRIQEFVQILARIDEFMAPISQADMERSDADLIRDEFTWIAAMLRHACWRMIWAMSLASDAEDHALRQRLAEDAEALMDKFRQIWHARNRPGGFEDSLRRMEEMRDHYRSEYLERRNT